MYGGLFDALRGNLVPVALGTAAAALVIAALTNRVLKRGLPAGNGAGAADGVAVVVPAAPEALEAAKPGVYACSSVTAVPEAVTMSMLP